MNEGELRVRLINLCAAQARLTESATWPWTDDTPQRADRDHALEQIISAVNHDRDAIAAVMHTDDDPAVFFRRGNACVSWDRVPEWARWVVVAESGRVFASEYAPGPFGEWSLAHIKQVAAVGRDCEDWESLIFERPQVKPLITADEWQHIRWMLPGAVVVAKDEGGEVFAYTSREMVVLEAEWYSRPRNGTSWDNARSFDVLQERFKNIPWRESAVYYKEDDKC